MASRYSKHEEVTGVIQSGYESTVPNDEESIQPCGFEDVDRAFFSLFSEKLPFFYRVSKDTGEQRRVPVVFASGERFAVLSKSTPLRDKNGALILPLISITRNSIDFESTKGGGSSDRYPETIIKRKLSADDPSYQSLINSAALRNGPSKFLKQSDWMRNTGRMLNANLEKNIHEITVIPTPKYFTAKYEVSIWCQYVQQLNSILEIILGSYPQPGGRTIRIDTTKGYWFVAYFEQSINQDNNFSDYSDSERLIKATITAEVPAYLILPQGEGIPYAVKKYISSPEIVFETRLDIPETQYPSSTVETGYPQGFILNDVETLDDPSFGDSIGTNEIEKILKKAEDSLSGNVGDDPSSVVGKKSTVKKKKQNIELEFDPFTGERKQIVVQVMDSVATHGEEVFYIISNNRGKS